MSNPGNINSLAALRDRQREIAIEEETAKKGLTSALAEAPVKAKDYALEDLALPALGIGLAAYVGYRVIRSGKKSEDRPRSGKQEVATTQLPVASRPQASAPSPVRHDPPAEVSRPVAVEQQRPVQPARPTISRDTKKGAFNLATVVAAGKLLIPAAQAIIGVVQNQHTKQQTKEQLDDTKEHIEATV